MADIAETLAERGAKYGSFVTHAAYAESLNNIYESSPNWKVMKPDAKEALRIIANKIGRILNGDPEYDDNWRDISGYATLVLRRLEVPRTSLFNDAALNVGSTLSQTGGGSKHLV